MNPPTRNPTTSIDDFKWAAELGFTVNPDLPVETDAPETMAETEPPTDDTQEEPLSEAETEASGGGKVIDFSELQRESYRRKAQLDIASWDTHSRQVIAFSILGLAFIDVTKNMPENNLVRRQFERDVHARGKVLADQLDKLGK